MKPPGTVSISRLFTNHLRYVYYDSEPSGLSQQLQKQAGIHIIQVNDSSRVTIMQSDVVSCYLLGIEAHMMPTYARVLASLWGSSIIWCCLAVLLFKTRPLSTASWAIAGSYRRCSRQVGLIRKACPMLSLTSRIGKSQTGPRAFPLTNLTNLPGTLSAPTSLLIRVNLQRPAGGHAAPPFPR
ncbi:hypothetical protein LY76DRAFT_349417 [Colletotrichum caudatum]|nr:hypothetical protein LY76DRAFT_349417 [Colletotrichum caudatum]